MNRGAQDEETREDTFMWKIWRAGRPAESRARRSRWLRACRAALLPLALLPVAPPLAASGGASDERQAITRAALDYGEGWYEGDAERMARALHPELAKRMVSSDPATGRGRISQQSAMTLVENTRRGGGKNAPVESRRSEVVILDVFENAAAVKVSGPEWVDYLQMAKWEGRWLIVNVLWELRPETRARRARPAER